MFRLAVLNKIMNIPAARENLPASTLLLLLQQLLAGVVAILILSVITALMAGALILGASYAAYELLIDQGMAPGMAQASLGIFLVLLIVLLAVAMAACARIIQYHSRRILRPSAPLTARLNRIVNAFFDGLLTPRLK